MDYKDCAYRVLKGRKKPLHSKKITQIAIQKGWLKSQGKTREQTMLACLTQDIKKNKPWFKKVARSTFTLNNKFMSNKREPKKTNSKRNKKTHSKVFTAKIDKFDIEILSDKRYQITLKKYIGNKLGIYALYDSKDKLCYIGKSGHKIMQRINQHRNNHLCKKWQRFSVFLTKDARFLDHFEDALISIEKPPYNKQKPMKIESLNSQIEKDIRKTAEEKINKIVGKKSSNRRSKKKRQTKNKHKQQSLKIRTIISPKVINHFGVDTPLMAKYKGHEHSATWLKSGFIKYKGKEYSSLSGATKAVGSGASGWTFWHIKDHQNNWVSLTEARKREPLKKAG